MLGNAGADSWSVQLLYFLSDSESVLGKVSVDSWNVQMPRKPVRIASVSCSETLGSRPGRNVRVLRDQDSALHPLWGLQFWT
jgi:hypothetical protein